MNINEKYNTLVYKFSKLKEGSKVETKDFKLEYSEFRGLIDEIELDGLVNRGQRALSGEYFFMGLTFKGRSFVENNDKKEYTKMEKTEINYNTNISVGRDNTGNIVIGDNNAFTSEYELKFNSLIEAISNSSINDKDSIIEKLQAHKEDKNTIQKILGNLLTRGAEVTSIAASAGALLGLL